MSEHTTRAAFGDNPGAPVFAAASGTGWPAWEAAVALGGQGHYAAARTTLARLARSADPVLAAAALTALASHRRQLGAHLPAARLDGAALGRLASAGRYPLSAGRSSAGAAGPPVRHVVVDVLLGLAADSIGRGDLAAANRLHIEAVRNLGSDDSWRPNVRVAWVEAEIALAQGAPDRALPASKRACDIAHSSDSVRHQTKSLLVHGVTEVVLALPTGVDFLRRVIELAGAHGLYPLVWPPATLLARRNPIGPNITGMALARP